MSSARSTTPKPGSTRLSLVGALADQQRRDSTKRHVAWRDPAQVGKALGLTWAATTAQVNRGEALGLIERKEIKTGERVALSDLGWKLFGLDDRKPRRSTSPLTPLIVEGRSPLVQLLIHWRTATALAEELANYLKRDVEEFWDEVLDAERAGEVETWPDHPVGPAVMLSGLAADRLGLSLSSDGSRWLRPREKDPTSIEQTWTLDDPFCRMGTEASLGGDPDEDRMLDHLADPDALEGWEAAGASEAGERAIEDILDQWTDPSGERLLVLDRKPTVDDAWDAGDRKIVVLPEPKVLLGQRLIWPVEHRVESGPCPGCRDASLGARTYCLVCSRSGLDNVIREILRREGQPRRIRAHRPEVAVKAGPRKGKPGRRSTWSVEGLRGGIG